MTELVCIADFQRLAASKLNSSALGYYNSGAGSELTLARNCSAFDK